MILNGYERAICYLRSARCYWFALVQLSRAHISFTVLWYEPKCNVLDLVSGKRHFSNGLEL